MTMNCLPDHLLHGTFCIFFYSSLSLPKLKIYRQLTGVEPRLVLHEPPLIHIYIQIILKL